MQPSTNTRPVTSNHPRQAAPLSGYVSRQTLERLHVREMRLAHELKAPMPSRADVVSLKSRLQTIGLVFASLMIVALYVGIPTVVVIHAFIGSTVIDTSLVLAIVSGIIMLIIGVLLGTSEAQNKVRYQSKIANSSHSNLQLEMEQSNV